jgi:hypothetical protein
LYYFIRLLIYLFEKQFLSSSPIGTEFPLSAPASVGAERASKAAPRGYDRRRVTAPRYTSP